MSAVEAVLDHGLPFARVAEAFGVSIAAVKSWVEKFQQGGAAALVPGKRGRRRGKGRSEVARLRRRAVVDLRTEHPEYGTRKVRDVLARFEQIGVSETQVRRILHEEGLIRGMSPKAPREHPPRRFERAKPGEMWQSDIFTFLLRKHERLYMVAFMDDCSRYIVGHAIAHHQKSTLVLEALNRAIAAYGCPKEILTDQGRQYTAWRGETDFERELDRHGIHHLKSRPQHPETVGKLERWWKTLWDEFLSRTVFADFDDCLRRVKLYVDYYNFKRPHQSLEGMTPSDRYFEMAPQLRETIERTVEANARDLAMQRPVRKPFYLVGRLGDQDLTIAAAGGELHVQMGSEPPTKIQIDKEQEDADETGSRETQEKAEADAPVDPGRSGGGRDGAEESAHDPERAERAGDGDGRDRAGGDLAGDVLQAGGEGSQGDGELAPAGSGRERAERGDDGGQEDRGAGGEAGADGEGEATPREAADGGLEDSGQRSVDDGSGQEEDLADALEKLVAWLGFDPDEGWRGRALRWERKLAGARAGVPGERREGGHGGEVHEEAGAQAGPGAEERGGDGGALWPDDEGGGSATSRSEPQLLPVGVQPRGGGDGEEPCAGEPGPARDERAGEASSGGEPGAEPAERAAEAGARAAAGGDRGSEPCAQGAALCTPGGTGRLGG
jgi:transposase InsO family protein